MTRKTQRFLIKSQLINSINRLLSSYTKNTRVSPSSIPSSLYEFSFSTERARWSVAESMRQDRRALSRDNIIILYGHASHAWKLRVRAKALRRKEEEEEVGNRVEVSQ